MAVGWGHSHWHPPLTGCGWGIFQRAVVVSDHLVMREHLGLTALFDRDVTDGAPLVQCLTPAA
jgi:hypothetical protein